MTHAELASVIDVRSTRELLQKMLRCTASMEFDMISASVILDGPDGGLRSASVDNIPSEYRATFEDVSLGHRDPVAQHCRGSCWPIIWDRETYVAAGEVDQWEFQARFGFRAGIALGMHLPRGRHLFIGMDRDGPVPSHPAQVARLLADLCLLATYVQDAAIRLLMPEITEGARLALTDREREALCWTMEGKTAWEVGRILNISEQTAARHLSNATKKLDCVTKHHAVVKALRAGII